LAKLAASTECIGKAPAPSAGLRNKREHLVEMILKKMLKQARGDSRPEVRIGVCTPFPCEAPDFLRVGLDIVSNADDALPARVQLAVGGFFAWENPLCIPYGVGDTHLLSQGFGSGTRGQ
jgi:hypothetical protein